MCALLRAEWELLLERLYLLGDLLELLLIPVHLASQALINRSHRFSHEFVLLEGEGTNLTNELGEPSLASQLLVRVEIVTVDGTLVAITTWVHCDDGAAELLAVIKRM